MTEAESRGTVGAAINACATVLGTLPGQFLALCLVNVLFVGGLLLFLERQAAGRERVITAIVTACLEKTLHP